MLERVAGRAIRRIVAELPEATRERLRFVTISHRAEPTAEDVKRGVSPTHRGYFFGHPVELEDSGEGFALPDEAPPTGEIAIFTGRIRPFTVGELARILLHEIGHALGYDHDVLEDELGLV